MDEPVDAERELRKKIADDAAFGAEPGATIFTQAFQFFLVPALIVAACVGFYYLFSWTMSDQRSPADWVREIQQGGLVAQKHAAAQLVFEISRQRKSGKMDAALVEPILRLFKSLPDEEAGTDSATAAFVGKGPSTRALVANCLALLGDRRATQPLLEALEKTSDIDTKAACIDALGAMRDPESAPALIKLLDHPSSVVRKYASFSLGAVAAPEKEGAPLAVPAAVEPLKARLNDPRPEVQWNAAFSLAFYLRDGSGGPVLRRMIDRSYVTETVKSGFKEGGGVGENTMAVANDLIAHAIQMGLQGIAALGDRAFLEDVRLLASGDPESSVRSVAMKTRALLEQAK